jgi:UDP-glucuronate 4-epimerase
MLLLNDNVDHGKPLEISDAVTLGLEAAANVERFLSLRQGHRETPLVSLAHLARWVYGPRRTTDCIIRAMITDALAGKPTRLAFGQNFYRQFIHVDDAARALVTAFEQPGLPRDTYNVTGGSYLTFPEIADAVRTVLPSADISIVEGDDPVDDRQTRFDIAAARRDLGFSPGISLVEGIRSYADWLGNKPAGEGR